MSDNAPEKKNRTVQWLKLLVKIAVSVACLWYVSKKIDFTRAGHALETANWYYLVVALVLFIVSKLISAVRLNIYFGNIGLQLAPSDNLRLYWLGMFYNLFLPGSIGGDAYKIVLLTRKYGIPYRKTAAAVLLDRFSGLLALACILAVYGFLVLNNGLYVALVAAGAVFSVAGLYIAIRFWFRDFIPSFGSTLLLGLLVQLSQVIAVYFILLSLHLPITQPAWIFIFLAAAVITVLPISLGGGLGTREFVFREGALFFFLDPDLAVIISLLFYLITLVGSLPGLVYVFRDPFKKNVESP